MFIIKSLMYSILVALAGTVIYAVVKIALGFASMY